VLRTSGTTNLLPIQSSSSDWQSITSHRLAGEHKLRHVKTGAVYPLMERRSVDEPVVRIERCAVFLKPTA
jgi:hypothetical protein